MSAREAKRAIGLMSGTSMDGIDVALVTTDGARIIERGPGREYPYKLAQANRLEDATAGGRDATDRQALAARFLELARDLTDWHAEAVERFERETGERAEIIGFHGQTIAHRPKERWTLQLADGERLSRALGRPVVYDFRTDDMAAGGQGAPLVPVYHEGLAQPFLEDGHKMVAFLNIGGVANATVVQRKRPPVAFDCGPGNVLVDMWVRREAAIPYDAGGRIASEGRVASNWVEAQFEHPFFEEDGPRSLDRLDFELPAAGAFDLADGARTLARFTAEAAARSLAPFAPDLTIVCGGGRLNDVMMTDLAALVSGRVATAEAVGLNGGTMEAEAFAYLAVRSLHGEPLTYPTTTGCRAPCTGGRIAGP